MSKIRQLASQTAIYGTSTILAKFLNYLLTPYFTRIMATGVYGEVTLLYGLIPFANVLLTMGMATAYFRWAAKAETLTEQKRLFTTLWGAVSMLALLFFALTTIFQGPISDVMGYSDRTWYLVMTAALIAVDNIAAIPLAALRQQGKALYYTVVNISGVLVNILCCYLFYTFIDGATAVAGWVIVANLIASGVSLLMLMPNSIKLLCRGFSMDIFIKVARYSLPLMAAGVMGVGGDFFDRQMLRWLLPEQIALSQLGIYGAVAKIAALMIIFRQIYTLGAEPFFLQNFKKDDFLKLNAAALKYFTIAGLFVVLGISLFNELFALIIDRSYRVGMGVVPILLVANLLMGILVNLSFWYKVVDKTRYAIYVTCTGLLTTVLLCIWLIPSMGYYGAALSHLGAATVMVTMSYYFNQRHYKVPYQVGSILIYMALTAVLYFAGTLLAQAIDGVMLYCCNFLLLLIFVCFAMWHEKLWKRLKL
ncbi:MAG: oligosaccharide flippase family protein [Mucinivorans sp.]